MVFKNQQFQFLKYNELKLRLFVEINDSSFLKKKITKIIQQIYKICSWVLKYWHPVSYPSSVSIFFFYCHDYSKIR